MKKPVILIVGEDAYDEHSHSPHFVMCQKYGDCVTRAGGIPVMAYDFRTIKAYAKLADGLLLTEGPKMHPAWYGQILESFQDLNGVVATRDCMDFMTCRAFLDVKKPVLGIGRGAKVARLTAKGEEKSLILCTDCNEKVFTTSDIFPRFLKMCEKGGAE